MNRGSMRARFANWQLWVFVVFVGIATPLIAYALGPKPVARQSSSMERPYQQCRTWIRRGSRGGAEIPAVLCQLPRSETGGRGLTGRYH